MKRTCLDKNEHEIKLSKNQLNEYYFRGNESIFLKNTKIDVIKTSATSYTTNNVEYYEGHPESDPYPETDCNGIFIGYKNLKIIQNEHDFGNLRLVSLWVGGMLITTISGKHIRALQKMHGVEKNIIPFSPLIGQNTVPQLEHQHIEIRFDYK